MKPDRAREANAHRGGSGQPRDASVQVQTRMRRGRILSAAVLLAFGTACEDLLDVELPGAVVDTALDDPALAELLVEGVITDFECAFSNYVAGTGLLTDELQHSSGLAAIRLWDLRQVTPDLGAHNTGGCPGFGFYGPLQTAGFQSEDVIRRLEGFTDQEVSGRAEKMATVEAYGAYALTLLGESMCEMTVDVGPRLTPAQTLELAEQRFGRAIERAASSGNEAALDLSLVGRARVRLNLGKGAEAVEDALQVPADFVAYATRSEENDRRRNEVWNANHNARSVVVDPLFRNVTWAGAPDPRVDAVDTGRGAAIPTVPLWVAMKHSTRATPIRLASWVEAQLIIAEVEGGSTAVEIINVLHDRAGIPGFFSDDPEEIRDQIREERRRELFLEGHRLNDMLRFDLPFPSGTHPIENQPYSTTTCVPLPFSETASNPNLDG